MALGVHATFMPKPIAGVQGSGMHTHLSLFEGDANAFYDPDDEYLLSTGQGRSSPDCCTTPRDHRRHQPAGQQLQATRRGLRGAGPHLVGPQQPLGAGAGAGAQAGQGGGGHPHRVPGARPRVQPVPGVLGDPRRRACGASSRATSCPPEAAANLFDVRGRAPHADILQLLPPSSAEALDEMERSDLVREALGEHIFEWFLRNKRAEWAGTRRTSAVRARAVPEGLVGEPWNPSVSGPIRRPGRPRSRLLDLAGLPWAAAGDESTAHAGGRLVRRDRRCADDFSPTRRSRSPGRCDAATWPRTPAAARARIQLADLDGRHDTVRRLLRRAVPPAELEARLKHLLAPGPGSRRDSELDRVRRALSSTSRPTRRRSTDARST
jgi:hypothetical protein